MKRPFFLPAALFGALALVSGSATAQIVNGDFEDGMNGWTISGGCSYAEASSVCFSSQGAELLMDGELAGECCITQEFTCDTNPQGVCRINLDMLFWNQDQIGGERAEVRIDGQVVFVDDQGIGQCWDASIDVAVPCGTHTIELCGVTEEDYTPIQLQFDNVAAVCEASPAACDLIDIDVNPNGNSLAGLVGGDDVVVPVKLSNNFDVEVEMVGTCLVGGVPQAFSEAVPAMGMATFDLTVDCAQVGPVPVDCRVENITDVAGNTISCDPHLSDSDEVVCDGEVPLTSTTWGVVKSKYDE